MELVNFENFKCNFCEIVINNSCPLDCQYCFLQNKGEIQTMDLETLKNSYRFLKELQEKSPQPFISFMYALKEPMVSWKTIEKCLDELEFDPLDFNIFSKINTNGVLVTDDIFDYCQHHCIDLHVSLDGPKDIHDRGRVYRGNNSNSSWDKVMELIYKHPYSNYFSLMCTLHKQDLGRTKEIFDFLSNLPVFCFVYALNKFDDWDDNSLSILESDMKSFINSATDEQLSKTRFVNTAAVSTNIGVTNGLKILQDGTIYLQPPVGGTEIAGKGDFSSRVLLGNVNNKIILPDYYKDRTIASYCVSGPNCNSKCSSWDECKQGTIPIYIDDFSCRRVQHFKRMSEYAKGGTMTDQEYLEIRKTYPIFSAIINLTDNCNLRCPYCFTEHNTRNIDLGTMKAAIMFILNDCDAHDFHGVPSFAFFGGEPMLRYDDIIVPTIKWAKDTGLQDKYHISWSMTTNGTLLTEERLQFLYDNNVGILLSIDGDKLTQDDQRPAANGASSFDMINIPLILKYYPDVTFRSAVEPRNACHILENYLFARNSGFNNYFITPNLYADWSIEDIKIALEQIACIAQVMYNDIKSGTEPCVWSEFFGAIGSIFMNPQNNEISYNHCGIGTNSVGIAVNGDLNGCQEHNTYVDHDIFYIGNIFTGIDMTRHKRLLEEFKKEKHPVCKDDPERCKTCDFYNDCSQHFCPSHNLLNGGCITNSLVTCMWKTFMYQCALIWLKQADEEGDPLVIKFIEELVTSGAQLGYAGW